MSTVVSGLEPLVAFFEGLLDLVDEGLDFGRVLRVCVHGEPCMQLQRFGKSSGQCDRDLVEAAPVWRQQSDASAVEKRGRIYLSVPTTFAALL